MEKLVSIENRTRALKDTNQGKQAANIQLSMTTNTKTYLRNTHGK